MSGVPFPNDRGIQDFLNAFRGEDPKQPKGKGASPQKNTRQPAKKRQGPPPPPKSPLDSVLEQLNAPERLLGGVFGGASLGPQRDTTPVVNQFQTQLENQNRDISVNKPVRGTVPNALDRINRVVGRSWRDDETKRVAIYQFVQSRVEAQGKVSDEDVQDAIAAIQTGDVRTLRYKIRANVARKFDKDPAESAGFPFRLTDLVVQMKAGRERGDMMKGAIPTNTGEPMPIPTAVKLIEQRTGMSFAQFLKEQAPQMGAFVKAERKKALQEQMKADTPVNDLFKVDAADADKSYVQYIGDVLQGVTQLPFAGLNRVGEDAAQVAASRYAELYGVSADEILNDPTFIEQRQETVKYAQAATLVPMVVAAIMNPMIGAILGAADYVPVTLQAIGGKLSGPEGQRQAEQAVKDWFSSIDPTDKKGIDKWLAMINLIGTVADTIGTGRFIGELPTQGVRNTPLIGFERFMDWQREVQDMGGVRPPGPTQTGEVDIRMPGQKTGIEQITQQVTEPGVVKVDVAPDSPLVQSVKPQEPDQVVGADPKVDEPGVVKVEVSPEADWVQGIIDNERGPSQAVKVDDAKPAQPTDDLRERVRQRMEQDGVTDEKTVDMVTENIRRALEDESYAKELLHTGNKTSRAMWESVTGKTLPRTEKGTQKVISEWFGEKAKTETPPAVVGKTYTAKSGRTFTPVNVDGDEAIDAGGNRVKVKALTESNQWAETPEASRTVDNAAEPQPQSTVEPETKQQGRIVGKNARGLDITEDERGVRSYTENGVKQTEPVQMRPTRGGMETSVDVSRRGEDFLTESERKPAEPKTVPPKRDLKDFREVDGERVAINEPLPLDGDASKVSIIEMRTPDGKRQVERWTGWKSGQEEEFIKYRRSPEAVEDAVGTAHAGGIYKRLRDAIDEAGDDFEGDEINLPDYVKAANLTEREIRSLQVAMGSDASQPYGVDWKPVEDAIFDQDAPLMYRMGHEDYRTENWVDDRIADGYIEGKKQAKIAEEIGRQLGLSPSRTLEKWKSNFDYHAERYEPEAIKQADPEPETITKAPDAVVADNAPTQIADEPPKPSEPEPPKSQAEQFKDDIRNYEESGERDADIDFITNELRKLYGGPLGSGLGGGQSFFEVASKELAERVVKFGVDLMKRGYVDAGEWMKAFIDVIKVGDVVEHISEIYREVKRRFSATKPTTNESKGVRDETTTEPKGSAAEGETKRTEDVADGRSDSGPREEVPEPDRGDGGERSGTRSSAGDRSSGNARPEVKNFRYEDPSQIGRGGVEGKTADLEAAINALKSAEARGFATPDEMAAMSLFPGWGWTGDRMNTVDPAAMARHEAWRNRIKPLLTDQEWDEAARATLNSHYTSPDVIDAVYDGIRRVGLTDGIVLEPSAGIGLFLGLTPKDLPFKWHAGELDSLTGRILKMLYPESSIHQGGYQDGPFRYGVYDAAISNVPFGNYPVVDPTFAKQTGVKALNQRIHNYFIAKMVRNVKPGGLVVVITSKGTLDATDSVGVAARNFIASETDFLGAIRLPDTAFAQNAGTAVVTDIIFLRRKDGTDVPSHSWSELKEIDIDGVKYRINEYFADNPDMVLGSHSMSGKMARKGGPQYTVSGAFDPQALKSLMNRLPQGVIRSQTGTQSAGSWAPVPAGVLPGSYFEHEGQIYQSLPGAGGVKVDNPPRQAREFFGLASATRALYKGMAENVSDEGLKELQAGLKQAYDTFVEKHGPVHAKANAVLEADPEYWRLLGLEKWDPKTRKVKGLSDIFTKRTIRPLAEVKPANATEALASSLAVHGRVNLDYMADTLGTSKAKLIEEMEGKSIFEDNGEWLPAEEYGSGNVRSRYNAVKAKADAGDSRFAPYVEFLERRLPPDIAPHQIHMRPGAPWIDTEIIAQFGTEVLSGGNGRVYVQRAAGISSVEGYGGSEASVKGTFGTSRITAYQLLELLMNNRKPVIRDKFDDGTSQINADETALAVQKQGEILDAFKRWVLQDYDRAKSLADVYNRDVNVWAPREFDGSHLQLPGAVAGIEFRPHQKNAVWRIIQRRFNLLDHEVGTGKTMILQAAAMELKRMGIRNKIVIAVPKTNISDFEVKFRALYPDAHLLVASDKNFSAAKRKEFMAQAAAGDWDAIVMTHDNMEKIPVSRAALQEFVNEEISRINEALQKLDEQGASKRDFRVKTLERAKQQLEAKLAKVNDESKDATAVVWDSIGVDQIFVDEAHEFKNLQVTTNIDGAAVSGSGAALDMYVKSQLIARSGGGVTMASGTPISNKVGEMHTLLRYLATDVLREMGIEKFDEWASTFALEQAKIEKGVDFRYKLKSRLSKFTNLPELYALYRNITDIVKAADVSTIKLPKMVDPEGNPTGRPTLIVLEPSPEQQAFFKTLTKRAENLSSATNDNMLAISQAGESGSIDLRFQLEGAEDLPNSKINEVVRQTLRVYNKKGKLMDGTEKTVGEHKGTQVIFLDQRKSSKNPGYDAYIDIRNKLVEGGIPENEIKFANDVKNDAERQALWDSVNSGEVRVLITSTAKGGQGANFQERLVAAHFLDPQWKPSEIEQRTGRIIRQGNTWGEVEVLHYIVQDSYDEIKWGRVNEKDRMIKQLMNGDGSVREMDFDEEETFTYAEMQAVSSGDPRVKRMIELEQEVRNLESARNSHQQNNYFMAQKAAKLEKETIPELQRGVTRFRAFLDKVEVPDEFKLTVAGADYTTPKEAGAAIWAETMKQLKGYPARDGTVIGSFAGAEIVVRKDYSRAKGYDFDYFIYLRVKGDRMPATTEQAMLFQTSVGQPEMLETQFASVPQKLTRLITDISSRLVRSEDEIARYTEEIPKLQEQSKQPFAKEEQWIESVKSLESLRAELGVETRKAGQKAEEENPDITIVHGPFNGKMDIKEILGISPALPIVYAGLEDEDKQKLLMGGLGVLALVGMRRGFARGAWQRAIRAMFGAKGEKAGAVAWDKVQDAMRAAMFDPKTFADKSGNSRLRMAVDALTMANANWRPRVQRDVNALHAAATKAFGEKWEKNAEVRKSLATLRDRIEAGGKDLTPEEQSFIADVQKIHGKFGPWAWSLGIGVQDVNKGDKSFLVGSEVRAWVKPEGERGGWVKGKVLTADEGKPITFEAPSGVWEIPPDAAFQRPIHELGVDFIPRVLKPEAAKMMAEAGAARREAAQEMLDRQEATDWKTAYAKVDQIAKAQTMNEGGRPVWAEYVNKFEEIAQQLVDKNPKEFSTLDDAKAWLQEASDGIDKDGKDIFTFMASLERSRKVQFASEHYIEDYVEAFVKYLDRAHKRISLVEAVGNPDPMALSAILKGVKQVDADHGEYLEKLLMRMFRLGEEKGQDKSWLRQVAATEGSIQSILKLTGGTTQLAQLSDFIQVLTRVETGSAFKGIRDLLSEDKRMDRYILSGAHRDMMGDLLQEDPRNKVQKLADAIHTWTLLKGLDRGVKTASVAIAFADVETLLGKAAKGPLSGPDARKASRYGLTAGDLAKGPAALEDEKVVNRVASTIRKDLIYTGAPEDNPLWMSSPIGTMVMRLRKPVYYVSRFLIRDVLAEAKAGNLKPLLKLMVIGGLGGEAVNRWKDLLTGRDIEELDEDEETMGKVAWYAGRGLDNLAATGSAGLARDMFSSYTFDMAGRWDPTKFAMPVTLSDFREWLSGGYDVLSFKKPFAEVLFEKAKRTAPIVRRGERLAKAFEGE